MGRGDRFLDFCIGNAHVYGEYHTCMSSGILACKCLPKLPDSLQTPKLLDPWTTR